MERLKKCLYGFRLSGYHHNICKITRKSTALAAVSKAWLTVVTEDTGNWMVNGQALNMLKNFKFNLNIYSQADSPGNNASYGYHSKLQKMPLPLHITGTSAPIQADFMPDKISS